MVSLVGLVGPGRPRPVVSKFLAAPFGGPVSELPTVGRWSLGGGLQIPDEPPNERPPGWAVNHSEETLPRISETTIRMQQQKALLDTRVPGRLSLSEDWRAECGVLTLFIELGSNKRGYRSEKRADWLV